jgi:hypothetical protein
MSESVSSEDSGSGSSSGCCSHGGPAAGWTTGVKGSDVLTADGVGDDRVVLYTKLVRGADSHEIAAIAKRLLKSGKDELIRDLVLMAFQTRDIRGGKGERSLFYTLMYEIREFNESLATTLVDLIPEYGSWRDVFVLADRNTYLRPALLSVAKKQLEADEAVLNAIPGPLRGWNDPEPTPAQMNPSISLLGKWAPREDKDLKDIAQAFSYVLHGRPTKDFKHSQMMAKYRRRLARLNAHLKTVETLECSNRWDEIEPARVPGRAREIKKRAYLNEKTDWQTKKDKDEIAGTANPLRHPADEKRMACRTHFQEHFEAAAAGKVKMTGTDTLYPHEIVEKAAESRGTATKEDRDSLNAIWAQMVGKAKAQGGLGSSVMMCDFSGSMKSGGYSSRGRHATPFWVSMAMGLMGSELVAAPFKGRFLTFDEKPTWVTIPDTADTLYKKLDVLYSDRNRGQGYSTDFQRAADMIIKELIGNRAAPGAQPKNLIVVTDMGFDAACGSHSDRYKHNTKTSPQQTHAQMIREAFRHASELVHGDPEAWPAPRVVIWNVASSYTDDHQAAADEEGVLTLSGWSPSLFKVLCEDGPRAQNPLEGLRVQLAAPRYDAVRERVGAWLAGGWREVI